MTFRYNKLKGRIKEVFGTQEKFSKALGIANPTLSLKLNNVSEFSQNEIWKAVYLLKIPFTEVEDYFFTKEVQKVGTNEEGAN